MADPLFGIPAALAATQVRINDLDQVLDANISDSQVFAVDSPNETLKVTWLQLQQAINALVLPFDNTGTSYTAENIAEALLEIDGVFGVNKMLKSTGDDMTGVLLALFGFSAGVDGLKKIEVTATGQLETENAISVSALGTGDRSGTINLFASDAVGQENYSARIQRAAGVNGDLKFINLGTGIVDFNTQVRTQMSTPTQPDQFTRKDYVDKRTTNFVILANGTGSGLPAGWSVSQGGVGGYNVTHGENKLIYPQATILDFPDTAVSIQGVSTTGFSFNCSTASSGLAQDTNLSVSCAY